MFTVTLYNNASDNRVVSKDITQLAVLSGTLRNETDKMSPVILVSSETAPVCNYAYVPEFGRYYYVNEIRFIRTGIYELHMSVDVLKSFNLSGVVGILSDTESTGMNTYLPSKGYVINSKRKTDIYQFSNGLLDTGEYILITAGGMVS